MSDQEPEAQNKSDDVQPKRPTLRDEHLLWLPALVSFLIYLPTAGSSFITDDRTLIVENPYLLNPSGIWQLWTHELWEASAMHVSTHYYRPLPMTLFWAQMMFLGPKLWWLRLGNFLIHAATATMLPRLMLRMSPRIGVPLAVAISLCWAVHPLNTEAVIWLSGRFDSLVGLCVVLALLANTHARRLVYFPLCFALALVSKEVGIILLPTVVLADLAREGNWRNTLRTEGAKWGIAVLIAGLYLFVRRALGIYGVADVFSQVPLTRFLSGFTELSVTYARLAIIPSGFDVHHWSVVQPLSLGLFVLAVYVAGFVGSLVYSIRNRNSAVIAGCVLASGSLALASIVGPTQQIFGDRFSFLAGIGLALALGQLLGKFANAPRNPLILLALASFGFSIATLDRGSDWQSEDTLLESALEKDPNNPHWLLLSAHASLRQNHVDESRATLQHLIQLEPTMAKAYNALCVTELRAGKLEQAEKACQDATKFGPKNYSTWLNLASVYVNTKRYDETLQVIEKSLALQPRNAEAEYLQALVFANRGEFDKVAIHMQRGLELAPNHRGLLKLDAQVKARQNQAPAAPQ